MATRLYFSAIASEVSAVFDAWTLSAGSPSLSIRKDKDGTSNSRSLGGGINRAANETMLCAQFVSPAMPAGILFNTGVTVKGQIRCLESAANDNINRQPISIRIFSRDGSTLRATLLALAHYGPGTTEWPSGTATNRSLADGDALTGSYTTVAGDRIVLEIGGQVSGAGGTSVTGTMIFTENSATDLPEDEVSTSIFNAWFEFSNNFSFEPYPLLLHSIPLLKIVPRLQGGLEFQLTTIFIPQEPEPFIGQEVVVELPLDYIRPDIRMIGY